MHVSFLYAVTYRQAHQKILSYNSSVLWLYTKHKKRNNWYTIFRRDFVTLSLCKFDSLLSLFTPYFSLFSIFHFNSHYFHSFPQLLIDITPIYRTVFRISVIFTGELFTHTHVHIFTFLPNCLKLSLRRNSLV